jgi:hypothetical protein
MDICGQDRVIVVRQRRRNICPVIKTQADSIDPLNQGIGLRQRNDESRRRPTVSAGIGVCTSDPSLNELGLARQPITASAEPRSSGEPVDIDYGLRKGLGGLLRQVVTDAPRDIPVLIFS